MTEDLKLGREPARGDAVGQPRGVNRRQGHARACLAALLGWFRDETDASMINLTATGDGVELYRSTGFADPRYRALQLRVAESPWSRG